VPTDFQGLISLPEISVAGMQLEQIDNPNLAAEMLAQLRQSSVGPPKIAMDSPKYWWLAAPMGHECLRSTAIYTQMLPLDVIAEVKKSHPRAQGAAIRRSLARNREPVPRQAKILGYQTLKDRSNL
jgi:hypothetical protein